MKDKNLGLCLLVLFYGLFMVVSVFAADSADPVFPDDQMPIKLNDLREKINWGIPPAQVKSILEPFIKESAACQEKTDNNALLLSCPIGELFNAEYDFNFLKGTSLIEYTIHLSANTKDSSPSQQEVDRLFDAFQSQLPMADLKENHSIPLSKWYEKTYYKANSWESGKSYYLLGGHRKSLTVPAFVILDVWQHHILDVQDVQFEDEPFLAYGQFDNQEEPSPSSDTHTILIPLDHDPSSDSSAPSASSALPDDIDASLQKSFDKEGVVSVPLQYSNGSAETQACLNLTKMGTVSIGIEYPREGTASKSPFYIVISYIDPYMGNTIIYSRGAVDQKGEGIAYAIHNYNVKNPGHYCITVKNNGYRAVDKPVTLKVKYEDVQ